MAYLNSEYFKRLEGQSLNTKPLSCYPFWKIDTDSWEGMSIDNIEALLTYLRVIFENWFGDEYVASKEIIFTNKQVIEKLPACFYTLGVISLYIEGESFNLFIDQAAHEICHMMSYRDSLSQIPESFMWFLESVCTAAALSTLQQIYWLCKFKSPIPDYGNYADNVIDYYNYIMSNIETNLTSNLAGFLVRNNQELRNKSCNRGLNIQFAYFIHKKLGGNIRFWRSIPYIGVSALTEDMSTIQFFDMWLKRLPAELKPAILSLCLLLGVF